MEKHNFLEDFTDAIGKEGVTEVGKIELMVKEQHEDLMNGKITMKKAVKNIKKTIQCISKEVVAGYIYSRVLQTTPLVHSNVIDSEPFTIIGQLNNRHWELIALATSWTFKISLEPLTSVYSLEDGDSRLFVLRNNFPVELDIEDHVMSILNSCIEKSMDMIMGKEPSLPLPLPDEAESYSTAESNSDLSEEPHSDHLSE